MQFLILSVVVIITYMSDYFICIITYLDYKEVSITFQLHHKFMWIIFSFDTD